VSNDGFPCRWQLNKHTLLASRSWQLDKRAPKSTDGVVALPIILPHLLLMNQRGLIVPIIHLARSSVRPRPESSLPRCARHSGERQSGFRFYICQPFFECRLDGGIAVATVILRRFLPGKNQVVPTYSIPSNCSHTKGNT
jgi:hypothetical protein